MYYLVALRQRQAVHKYQVLPIETEKVQQIQQLIVKFNFLSSILLFRFLRVFIMYGDQRQ